MFACILAAVCHDFQHVGTNNSYLTRVRHDLAVLYNDQSVLENHHAAASWRVAVMCGITAQFDSEEMSLLREIFVSLILATGV